MRYLVGLMMLALGIGLSFKTEWLINNFGTSAWAEDKFGTSGGTRMMLKFAGLAIFIIGFIVLFRMEEGFISGTMGKLFLPPS